MLIGHFIHFPQTRSQIGSRTLTRGNFSPFPISHLKCNKSHSGFQFWFLPGKLLNFRKLLGIILYLLIRKGYKISIPSISTDKKRTADNVIATPTVRLHSIYFTSIFVSGKPILISFSAISLSSYIPIFIPAVCVSCIA